MGQRRKGTRRARRRHDRAGHLKRWKASGLSQAEFCRRHDLNQTLLSRWKSGVRKEVSKGLIEVPQVVVERAVPAYPYEIVVSGRIRIRVGERFDPLSLGNLIRLVQGL